MRACFVLSERSWTGRTRAFVDAASLLQAQGYETAFVAPTGSPVLRALAASGVDVVGLELGGGWLAAAWRLRRVVAAKLVEVLWVHDDREHLVAAGAARLAGRAAIVRRTANGERLQLGRDGRLAMRLAATAFAFAHPDDLRVAAPPRGALAAHVVPMGVDVAPAAALWEPTIAVYCGAGRRVEALRALRTLGLIAPRVPALRAIVVAEGDDHDALRLEAAALGVADRVTWRTPEMSWRGASNGAAIAWILATGDDAVSAILDAGAESVPVLAEHGAVTARLLADGESAILTHRIEEAECASVLAGLLADAARRARLATGVRDAVARYPRAQGVDGLLRVCEAARDRTRWIA